MNGKVDFEGLHINEPWGTYKEMDFIYCTLSWETIKFDLERDIAGIKIEM